MALPQVKKKMTSDEFIRNNRGINAGDNLPQDFLRALYESISRNEIRISSDASAAASPVLWTQLAQASMAPRGELLSLVSLREAPTLQDTSVSTPQSREKASICAMLALWFVRGDSSVAFHGLMLSSDSPRRCKNSSPSTMRRLQHKSSLSVGALLGCNKQAMLQTELTGLHPDSHVYRSCDQLRAGISFSALRYSL